VRCELFELGAHKAKYVAARFSRRIAADVSPIAVLMSLVARATGCILRRALGSVGWSAGPVRRLSTWSLSTSARGPDGDSIAHVRRSSRDRLPFRPCPRGVRPYAHGPKWLSFRIHRITTRDTRVGLWRAPRLPLQGNTPAGLAAHGRARSALSRRSAQRATPQRRRGLTRPPGPGLCAAGSSSREGTTTTQSFKEDKTNTTRTSAAVTVTILPNTSNALPGKLADVELHFVEGPLNGLT